MKNIKAIFVDFDWTIYDHKVHAINMSGINALRKAKEKGILVFLNSARTYFSLKGMDNILDLVDFDGYCCSNGLINLSKNKTISASYIDENILKEIISIADTYKINYLLTKDKVSYLKVYDEQRMKDFYFVFNEPRGLDMSLLDDLNNIYAVQLFVTKDEEKVFDSLKYKIKISRFFDLALELQSEFKNKGDSLEIMMKHYNLKPEECIAIGDSDDDINMFKKVKYGICMGNGNENAKANAYYVTDTIENNGLEKALSYFLNFDK